jgi:hypothetical protein
MAAEIIIVNTVEDTNASGVRYKANMTTYQRKRHIFSRLVASSCYRGFLSVFIVGWQNKMKHLSGLRFQSPNISDEVVVVGCRRFELK